MGDVFDTIIRGAQFAGQGADMNRQRHMQDAVFQQRQQEFSQDQETFKHKKMARLAGMLVSAPPPMRAQMWAQIAPQFNAEGLPVPQQWSDDLLPMAQQYAQAYGDRDMGGKPSQQQYAEWLLGQVPAADREQALGVLAGTRARPATGGMAFGEMEMGDGRKRQFRKDPRTGALEVLGDDGGWVPYGPGAPSGNYGNDETNNYVQDISERLGGIPQGSPEQIADAVFPEIVWQESRGRLDAVSPVGARGPAQIMPDTGRNPGFGVDPLKDGSPRENLRMGRDYFLAMVKRYPGRLDLALAAYNAGPGAADKISAASRTPEETKGLETAASEQAKIDAQVANAPRVAGAEAEVARQKALGEARGKGEGEMALADDKKVKSGNTALGLLDEVETILPAATGSLVGVGRDAVAGAFGKSTSGAQAAAQLRTIAGQLTMMQPRMEGPQSVYDAQLYAQMAGDLGNDRVPVETRMAAARGMRKLIEKYAGNKPKAAEAAGPKRRKFNPTTGRLE